MEHNVSILIFVEIVLEVSFSYLYFLIFFVSILIFVEIVLEVLDMMTKSGVKSSFNPYFRGDSSGRGIELDKDYYEQAFQSLFSWR